MEAEKSQTGEKAAIGKIAAAERALGLVQNGMVVGLGTGSTAEIFVRKLAERVSSEKIDVRCIPTSQKTAALARALGLKLIEIEEYTEIDLTVDGADEVSPKLDLIKGMGGALLWEKIVAKMSRKECIVVDSSKLVKVLGEKTPVPIEVVPYGWKKTKQILETKFGCRAELRRKCGEIYSTDSENYILDCKFERIEEPEAIEREIKSMTGVIESGLFCGIATLVIVGDENGKIREIETSRTT